MEFITFYSFLRPLWEANAKKNLRRELVDKNDYLKAMLDAINGKCAKGYRLSGLIYDKDLDDQAVICLVKDTPHRYRYTQYEEIATKLNALKAKGIPFTDGDIITAYNEKGEVGCTVYLPNIDYRPFYFIDIEPLKGEPENDSSGKVAPETVEGSTGTGKKTSGKSNR